MTPVVAVCLQTCERAELTARTLASFARHNGAQRFVRLHGDDASTDPRIARLAAAYGFQTVVQTTTRQGVIAVRAALIEAALAAGAGWVLILENDIDTDRAFPWPLFRHVLRHPRVYCLRLYGRFKDRARQDPCLTTHKRRGHTPVRWRPFRDAPEGSQVGEIHWSAQPCVTRIAELRRLHRTGDEPDGLTVRVKRNVMFHAGAERTPGRIV